MCQTCKRGARARLAGVSHGVVTTRVRRIALRVNAHVEGMVMSQCCA